MRQGLAVSLFTWGETLAFFLSSTQTPLLHSPPSAFAQRNRRGGGRPFLSMGGDYLPTVGTTSPQSSFSSSPTKTTSSVMRTPPAAVEAPLLPSSACRSDHTPHHPLEGTAVAAAAAAAAARGRLSSPTAALLRPATTTTEGCRTTGGGSTGSSPKQPPPPPGVGVTKGGGRHSEESTPFYESSKEA